jgi:hypothetical protein
VKQGKPFCPLSNESDVILVFRAFTKPSRQASSSAISVATCLPFKGHHPVPSERSAISSSLCASEYTQNPHLEFNEYAAIAQNATVPVHERPRLLGKESTPGLQLGGPSVDDLHNRSGRIEGLATVLSDGL